VAAAADASASSKARRKRKAALAAAAEGAGAVAAAAATAAAAAAWANPKVQQRAYGEAWLALLRLDLPDDIYKKVRRPGRLSRLARGAVARRRSGQRRARAAARLGGAGRIQGRALCREAPRHCKGLGCRRTCMIGFKSLG
jgi:hypothetical protein